MSSNELSKRSVSFHFRSPSLDNSVVKKRKRNDDYQIVNGNGFNGASFSSTSKISPANRSSPTKKLSRRKSMFAHIYEGGTKRNDRAGMKNGNGYSNQETINNHTRCVISYFMAKITCSTISTIWRLLNKINSFFRVPCRFLIIDHLTGDYSRSQMVA